MGGIGVAVEELDEVFRPVHEGVVDALLGHHSAHGYGAVGQALGHAHQVGSDAEGLRRKGRAGAAEAGDDLVEDQQDAVPVADLAQALQVALRRHQHAGTAGHGLDDDGGDGAGVMQRDAALQVVGKLRTMRGLAHAEGVACGVMRVADVVHARQHRAEHLAVGHHAAHRDAAEVHPVVTALAADEAGARGLATHAVVGQGHLQRRLDGLRPGIGEEDLVHASRGDLRQPVGQFEGLGVRHLERRRKVHLAGLLLDGLHDARAAVAGVHAPQAGGGVQHLPAAVVPVMHALSASQQAGFVLELPVGCERHPVGAEVLPADAGVLGGLHQRGVDGLVHGGSLRGTAPPRTQGLRQPKPEFSQAGSFRLPFKLPRQRKAFRQAGPADRRDTSRQTPPRPGSSSRHGRREATPRRSPCPRRAAAPALPAA